MSVISLAEEVFRRKVGGPDSTEAPEQVNEPAFDAGDIITKVSNIVLDSYAETVNEVTTGQKEPAVLERLVAQIVTEQGYGTGPDLERTIRAVLDNILRYGILQPLIDDEAVTDVFVNGPDLVYKRVSGRDIRCPEIRFRDVAHLEHYVRSILAKTGQRITQAQPLVDARDVANHIRINAGIPPSAKLPYLAIRKHTVRNYTAEDFLANKTFTPEVLEFLRLLVQTRMNILVAGPTGSGKSTLLRFLADNFIPKDERIVVMEEEEELQINHPNQVALEAKKASGEDDTTITLDDLVRNALRMAMRRMILGELRGAEAFALIRAFGTGHDGGMTTIHANDLCNAIDQVAVMMLYADTPLTFEHFKLLIAQAINVIVYVEDHRVTDIAFVTGYDRASQHVRLEPIFETRRNEEGELEYVRHALSQQAKALFWRRGVAVE